MTVIADLPDTRPSVLLDFANSRRVHPLIQCTRASAATCYGPDGQLRTVGANVPRIDFDPATGKCLGLLIEDASANLLTHSNNFADASWSKSPEISMSAVDAQGFTTFTHPGGAVQLRNMNRSSIPMTGTVATVSVEFAPGTLLGAAILLGINGTSQYARVSVLDILTGSCRLEFGGVINATNATFKTVLTRQGCIVQLSVDAAAAGLSISTVAIYIYIGQPVSAQVAGTLRMRNVQLEAKGHATSHIPTTTTQVTRAADTVRWVLGNNSKRAFIVDLASYAGYSPANVDANQRRHVFALNPANGSNAGEHGFWFLHSLGLYSVYRRTDATLATLLLANKAITDEPVVHQIGVSMDGAMLTGCLDGVAGAGAVDMGNAGSIATTLTFGAQFGSRYLNGHIRRMAIYDVALTVAQLQKLTAQ